MQSPNVFKTKSHKSPRNPFDLGHDDYFTKSAGLLTPIYCEDTLPGDYFKVNVSAFTRTETLNSAAYTRIHEYVDFYFIPNRIVWRWFSDMESAVPNTDSSYNPNNNSVPTKLPYILGSQLYTLLNGTQNDVMGLPLRHTLHRMMSFLGFPTGPTIAITKEWYNPNATISPGKQLASKQFSVLRLFAFTRIYRDYYRNTDWEPNDSLAVNLDKYASGGNVTDADLLHWFVYLSTCYKNIPKDMFMSQKPSPLYSTDLQPIGTNTDSFAPPFTSSGTMTNANKSIPSTPFNLTLSAQTIRQVLALERVAQLVCLLLKHMLDK